LNHVFAATHANKLLPATAFVLKKNSPVEHDAGRIVPVLIGFVVAEPEKSTFFPCCPRSILV
jgi:hypothetical protein